MIHLRSLAYAPPARPPDEFPFNVPFVRALAQQNAAQPGTPLAQEAAAMQFDQPVTFFVGENGSGKSTLLEALACAAGSITVGAEGVGTDPTLAAVRLFARYLKLVWNKRTRRGFFMRSEDFFGYARTLAQTKAALRADLDAVDREYAGRSDHARALAKLPYARELSELKRYYGEDLDAQSHGESFFVLFRSRFVPDGLYLLDEPEAPLSPTRQLALLALLHEAVTQHYAQFIIATHSPLLLAYPGAAIWQFAAGEVRPAAYESLEHVTLTRDFLNNPERFLRHLLE